MVTITVTISNPSGLHARAAAKLVVLCTTFESSIRINRVDRDHVADGKSILSVLALTASNGTRLKLEVIGIDEDAAADAVRGFLEVEF